MANCLTGIDVAMGSTRAGIFDHSGNLVAKAKRGIAPVRDEPVIAGQSSNNIVWEQILFRPLPDGSDKSLS